MVRGGDAVFGSRLSIVSKKELNYKAEAMDLATAVLAYDRALHTCNDSDTGMDLALAYLEKVRLQARRVLGLSLLSMQGGHHHYYGNGQDQNRESRREGEPDREE